MPKRILTKEQKERYLKTERKKYQSDPVRRAKYNAQSREFRKNNREHVLAHSAARIVALRQEVIKFLGGECVSCGLSDHRALELDHIHGDGYKDTTPRNYTRYNVMLADKNLSNRLQLLCGSCHNIKTYEKKEHRRVATRPNPSGDAVVVN